MAELIRLRDLPGMRRIIELAADPRQHSETLATTLTREAYALSIRLFRIDEWDTRIDLIDVDDDDPAALTNEQIKRIDE